MCLFSSNVRSAYIRRRKTGTTLFFLACFERVQSKVTNPMTLIKAEYSINDLTAPTGRESAVTYECNYTNIDLVST